MNNLDIERLIKMIAKLPGFGQKSAKRATLYMLQNKENFFAPFITTLQKTHDTIVTCKRCGNLDTNDICHICQDSGRDMRVLCLVENVADLWAMERTKAFHGEYHVLGGTLSAIDGITPDDLTITALMARIAQTPPTEIIIALKATVDGQTTAHYLQERINDFNADVNVTRLAHGMPVGGELDYMDEGTIMTALKSRQKL